MFATTQKNDSGVSHPSLPRNPALDTKKLDSGAGKITLF